MGQYGEPLVERFIATVDLSSYQHKAVAAGSGDRMCGPVSGAGIVTAGILQNKPAAAGRGANVAIFGVTKAQAGGTITAGADVTADATSTLVVATSGTYILGRALTAVASGYLFELLITHAGFKG